MIFYKQLANFKGKRVEIYTIGDSSSNVETGIFTDIVTSSPFLKLLSFVSDSLSDTLLPPSIPGIQRHNFPAC
jgi:hypothetical protein